jgi:hypothetical protein
MELGREIRILLSGEAVFLFSQVLLSMNNLCPKSAELITAATPSVYHTPAKLFREDFFVERGGIHTNGNFES